MLWHAATSGNLPLLLDAPASPAVWTACAMLLSLPPIAEALHAARALSLEHSLDRLAVVVRSS